MDETDNHVQSFWSDVLGALAVVDIVPADSALRHMTPAAGFGARELTQIREALAELPEVLVLVLDDFQQVSNPAVLESFGQLLDHQPPQLRLVLATRSDPALRLHRLRVNGEVTDVRAHDLAFGSTEAAELFARNGLRLSEGQLTVLLDRTQGWAAGLRLALMCLDPGDIDGGISRFTGSDHLVAEYLIEEVTDQLPEQDREFLLMTSVADRLAAGLANELTGRSDGQLSLERLASRNSLVVDLAGRSEWFSVHPLLRELLLHRLSRDRPGIVADVHLRASRWFAQQGEPIPAIRHAGRALDWDEVGRPLAALGLPLVLTPSGPALVAALGPAAAHALVAPTTSTLLAAALCHYHRHDFEAMAHNARDAAALMVDVRPNDRPAAAVTIALLDVVYARTRNPAATTGRASTLLALLDQVPRWQMPVIEHYRVVATNNIALGRLWAGDLAAAETNLASVQTRCAEMGLGLVELSALAHLALLDAIHGRFPDAAGRADAGQRIAERRGWSSEPQALALYAALALTDIATNRLDAAQASIDAGLNVSNGGSDIACRLALAIAAVEVAVARHDPSAARAAAACLTSIQAHAGALPAMLARWCAVTRADMHLSAGQAQAAIDLLADENPESGGVRCRPPPRRAGQGPTAAASTRRRARPVGQRPSGTTVVPGSRSGGPDRGRRRGRPNAPRDRCPVSNCRRDRPRTGRRHDRALCGRRNADHGVDRPPPTRRRNAPHLHQRADHCRGRRLGDRGPGESQRRSVDRTGTRGAELSADHVQIGRNSFRPVHHGQHRENPPTLHLSQTRRRHPPGRRRPGPRPAPLVTTTDRIAKSGGLRVLRAFAHRQAFTVAATLTSERISVVTLLLRPGLIRFE